MNHCAFFVHLRHLIGSYGKHGRRRRPKRQDVLVLIHQQAKSPNYVWTVDFVYDTLASNRSIRLLSVVDEFTRECLCLRVEYSLKAADVQTTLETLFKDYGKPLYLRSDNESEFIEKSLQKWLKEKGTLPLFIDPGSPWHRKASPWGKTANVRALMDGYGMNV